MLRHADRLASGAGGAALLATKALKRQFDKLRATNSIDEARSAGPDLARPRFVSEPAAAPTNSPGEQVQQQGGANWFQVHHQYQQGGSQSAPFGRASSGLSVSNSDQLDESEELDFTNQATIGSSRTPFEAMRVQLQLQIQKRTDSTHSSDTSATSDCRQSGAGAQSATSPKSPRQLMFEQVDDHDNNNNNEQQTNNKSDYPAPKVMQKRQGDLHDLELQLDLDHEKQQTRSIGYDFEPEASEPLHGHELDKMSIDPDEEELEREEGSLVELVLQLPTQSKTHASDSDETPERPAREYKLASNVVFHFDELEAPVGPLAQLNEWNIPIFELSHSFGPLILSKLSYRIFLDSGFFESK